MDRRTNEQTNRRTDGRTNGRTDTERGCRIDLVDYRCKTVVSDRRMHVVNLYIRLPLSTPSLVVVVSLCLLCKLSLKQDQKQWSSRLSRVCHLCPFAFFDFPSQFVMQCVWISTNVFANWFEVSRSLNWSWDLYFQFLLETIRSLTLIF
jgi:hypothetical protein